MRNGFLDAGLLTAAYYPTSTIGGSAQSVPRRSARSTKSIRREDSTRLEKRLRGQGFLVLSVPWGCVRFFSKHPVVVPLSAMQAVHLVRGCLRGRPIEVPVQAVALDTITFSPRCRRLIEALPMPPYVALTTQVSGRAYMLQLDGPDRGRLVVTDKKLNQLC